MNYLNPMDIIYNNMQSIFPWNSNNKTTINIAGNQQIEDIVVSEVASYGSQLGWLSEIVLALAKKSGLKLKEVEQLAKAVESIEKIKSAVGSSAKDRAVNALEKLKEENQSEFNAVIQKYAYGIEPAAAPRRKKSAAS